MEMKALFESYIETFGVKTEVIFLGNTVGDYVLGGMVFVGLMVLFKFIQLVILSRLEYLTKHTTTDIDDIFIRIVGSIRPKFYGFLALYIATRVLILPLWADSTLVIALLVFAIYQVVHAFGIFIDYVGDKKLKNENGGDDDSGSHTAVEIIKTISQIGLWTIGILLILSNLGIEVTSLIAGLGIGGIAIAFALQAVLGDLFSSFTIYFDKPFKVGDFIVVGDLAGTVERVGIKTTRLRALQGEEVIISNSDLTGSRIHNYKRMDKRRILFSFGVVYETPVSKLKEIPSIVENVFKAVENAALDRAHFKSLGDFSLNFEIVYHVLSDDYGEYMDIQQRVNTALREAFETENIAFAFPTQTVYVAKT